MKPLRSKTRYNLIGKRIQIALALNLATWTIKFERRDYESCDLDYQIRAP